ncbi:hypothetical protein [Haladaptatus sp. DJG-WS-42]|uniref:hypothetical protein n=1 Tax=Haladaptatus sp. DJG-WS-42 TaxID=3120516 RepID=UPI0030CEFBCC
MLRWDLTASGVRLSNGSTSFSFTAPDWHPTAVSHTLPRHINAVTAGTASRLQLPAPTGRLVTADGTPLSLSSSRSLTADTHYLTVGLQTSRKALLTDGSGAKQVARTSEAGFETTIAFDGPARIRPLGSDLCIDFDQQTAVTVGVPHKHTISENTITVTPTPEGIATALTHLAAGMPTTGPERSHPAWRHHPPLVEIGSQIDVPVAIQSRTPQTGIELKLPPDTEYLYVAAPLAYYLGARVTVENRAAPVLLAPDADVAHAFNSLPAFQHEVASLLRRVFFVDCLLRDDGHRTSSSGDSLLTAWGLSPESLMEASLATRLAATLTIPHDEISPHLPEWYLATYVDADPTHVRSFPFLLDSMSLVYLPEASAFDGKELIRRSLDDFYRAGPQAASVDVLMPRLQAGYLHGWLASGTPIDVFKLTHAAYENRLKYGHKDGDQLTVNVVLNDDEMDAEHEEVAAIYRNRAVDVPIDLTVHKSLKCKDLAAVFESPTDFVHYIGHCDVDGLRCPDGNLSIADIGEIQARTFFLNACGSYHEGVSLVEKGSVVGAVTLTKVLNDQAAIVGTAFARLLINGYDFERAMQLARRRIMMGKDYAVVGDGTYALTPADEGTPAVAWIEKRGDRFDLTYEAHAAWANGATYPNPRDDTDTNLYGSKPTYSLSKAELRVFLDSHDLPVIFDGDFTWTTDLIEKL